MLVPDNIAIPTMRSKRIDDELQMAGMARTNLIDITQPITPRPEFPNSDTSLLLEPKQLFGKRHA